MNKNIPIVVLGVGSIYSDDRIGLLVAENLQNKSECQQLLNENLISIQFIDNTGISILKWLQLCKNQLIIIDMVKTNLNEIGQLFILKGDQIAGFSGMLSSHSFGVSNTLSLAKSLGIDISKVILFGIEGSCHSSSDIINPKLLGLIDEITLKIYNYIIEKIYA